MPVQYKKKCSRCMKNYVLTTWKQQYPVCHECHKKEMQGEITDPKMKKMFDIPEKFYEQNQFLRSIKVNYLRYGKLSERQIDAFTKTVEKMKEENKVKK